jgi:hypothetical protein
MDEALLNGLHDAMGLNPLVFVRVVRKLLEINFTQSN